MSTAGRIAGITSISVMMTTRGEFLISAAMPATGRFRVIKTSNTTPLSNDRFRNNQTREMKTEKARISPIKMKGVKELNKIVM